jgi:hypothetical protein
LIDSADSSASTASQPDQANSTSNDHSAAFEHRCAIRISNAAPRVAALLTRARSELPRPSRSPFRAEFPSASAESRPCTLHA